MRVLKTLPYVFFSVTILLIIPLVTGFSEDFKTFGVQGSISFEDASSKGALIVLTTSDQNPFGKNGDKETLYFEQYLQESGYFYRKINELGGEDINIWIKQKGYPIVQVTKVLDPVEDSVNFENITIPAKLRTSNQTPVDFFKAPCEENPAVSVDPAEVRTVRNFYSLKCEQKNRIQFKAEIDLIEGAKEAKSQTIVLSSRQLATVIF